MRPRRQKRQLYGSTIYANRSGSDEYLPDQQLPARWGLKPAYKRTSRIINADVNAHALVVRRASRHAKRLVIVSAIIRCCFGHGLAHNHASSITIESLDPPVRAELTGLRLNTIKPIAHFFRRELFDHLEPLLGITSANTIIACRTGLHVSAGSVV